MAENRQYDHEYKVQAVKLAKEIGQAKAAKELGIPKNTMYGWVRANRLGNLDLGAGSQTPQSAMTLNEELLKLRQQVKELEKDKSISEDEQRRADDEIQKLTDRFVKEVDVVVKNKEDELMSM